MSLQAGTVLAAVIMCVCISYVTPLQCVQCSSLTDDKCGITFGYSEVPSKLLVTCEGDVVACKKLQHKEVHKSESVVTRSCWNTTSHAEMEEVLGCNEMDQVKACYCNEDGGDKPCNGGQLLMPSLAVVLLGLANLIFQLLH